MLNDSLHSPETGQRSCLFANKGANAFILIDGHLHATTGEQVFVVLQVAIGLPTVRLASVIQEIRMNRQASSRYVMRSWILVLTVFFSTTSLIRSEDATATRLRSIIYKNPRLGSAFTLWFQHHADSGSIDDATSEVQRRAEANPNDYASMMVWGLLNERLSRYDEAQTAYSACQKIAPQRYYPLYRLGELLVREKEYEKAIVQFEAAMKQKIPGQDFLSIAKTLATCHLRTGEQEKARAAIKMITDRYSTDQRVTSEMASWLTQEGQYQDAHELWDRVKKMVAADSFHAVDADLNIAQIFLETNKSEKAIKKFAGVLDRLKPSSWKANDVRNRIEDAILRSDGFLELIAFWEKRVQANSDDLESMVRLATAMSRYDKNDEAVQRFQSAIDRAPNRIDIRKQLIEHYVRNFEFRNAAKHASLLLQIQPDDVQGWLDLGTFHLRVQDRPDVENVKHAIQAWKNIADIRPDDAGLAVEVAKACRSALKSATPLNADSSRSQTDVTDRQTDELLARNRPLLETAEQYYREAIKRNPSAVQYYEYLGEFFHSQKQYSDAITTWNQMARGDTALSWQQLSRVFARFEYHAAAVAAAKKSLAADKNNLDLRKDLVEILIKMQDFDQATREAKHIVELANEPRWEKTGIHLQVDVAKMSNQVRGWLKDLDAAAKKNRTDYRRFWKLALLRAHMTQTTAARKGFRGALVIAPNHIPLNEDYAEYLINLGDEKAALEQLQHLLAIDTRKQAYRYRQMVQIHLQHGNFSAAQKSASDLVRVAATDPAAFVLQATVALKRKDDRGRIQAIRRAVQLAPNEIEYRRLLAQALSEAGLNEKSNLHAYRCFEMTDSAIERTGILRSMIENMKSEQRRDDLIAKIEVTRRRAKDPLPITMSLIDAYDLMNRKDLALEELLKVHRIKPQDLMLMNRIVDYAEKNNAKETAVTFQEKIVSRFESSTALERLARLYRIVGRLDDATAVWDRLFKKVIPESEVLVLIDRRIKQADLYMAQTLTEYGISKYPDNWKFAYMSGMIHLQQKQLVQAGQSFERVVRSKPIDLSAAYPANNRRGTVTNIEDPELLLTSQAVTANQEFMVTKLFQQRPRNSRSRRRPSFTQAFGQTTNYDLAQARSLVALLTMVHKPQEAISLIEKTPDDIANLQELKVYLAFCWAAGRNSDCHQLAERILKLDSDSALPHSIRILSPLKASEADEKHLRTIKVSFDWIRENKPSYVPVLQFHYNNQLYQCRKLDGIEQVAKDEIEKSNYPEGLVGIISLVSSDKFIESRRRLHERARQLFKADDSQFLLIHRMSLLDSAASLLKKTKAETDANDTFKFLNCVLQSYVAPSRDQQVAMAQRTLPISQILRQHQQSISYRGMLTGNRSRISQSFQLNNRFFVQQGIRVRSARIRPNQSTSANAFGFPSATREIDPTRLQYLRTVVKVAQESGYFEQLVQSIVSAEENPNVFRVAHAYVMWLGGDKDQAVQILEDVVEKDEAKAKKTKGYSANSTIQLALVRAYLETKKYKSALGVLNEVRADSNTITAVTLLRNTIKQHWSHIAFRHEFKGHNAAVNSLAFSPDGKLLASGSADATVRIWEVESGKLLHVFKDPADLVMSVAFSNDGKTLAAAGYHQSVILWDTADFKIKKKLSGHNGVLRTLAFSDDDVRLAAGGDSKQIVVWNLKSDKLEKRLEGHSDTVSCVKFISNSEQMLTGSHDGTAKIWDVKTQACLHTLDAKAGPIRGVAELAENKFLTGSQGRTLSVWSLKDDEKWSKRSYTPSSPLLTLAISPQASNVVALGCEDSSVQVWDIDSQVEQEEYDTSERQILSVQFDRSGKYLASSSFGGTIKLWKTHPLEEDVQE